MTRWLRRLFTSPAPLPGVTVEAHARLAVELASLRQRMHAIEERLAMEMRLRAQLVEAVARHSRDLAWLSALEAGSQGALAVRVAKLELTVMPEASDGAQETSEALDQALEAVARQRAGGEA